MRPTRASVVCDGGGVSVWTLSSRGERRYNDAGVADDDITVVCDIRVWATGLEKI